MKNPSELRIDVAPHGATSGFLYPAGTGAAASGALIFAHGAGAGQRSPFVVEFARETAALGFDVVTFNFLYMEQRRRAPDRTPVLEACYRAVMAAVKDETDAAKQALFIGGKSMGGRIATQVAAADPAAGIAGIVLLGYPLHPPGRPDQRRDAHLPSIERPMLFVQGSRDAFGTPGELAPVLAQLGTSAVLHVVEGGDHSFKVSRAAAGVQASIFKDIQRTVASWMTTVSGR